jgi:rubrerythrin
MAITFSADEILEMAEQIERSAAGFYREAAGKTADAKVQKLFTDLALMEDGHCKIFQDMRKSLNAEDKEATTFDPNNEAILYLQAMADSHGTEGEKGRGEKLTGNEPMKEIYDIAINAEKDSVVFYTALKEMVPPGTGRDKVVEIIDEELGHLVMLKIQLANLKPN